MMGYLGSTIFIGAIGIGTIIISYLIFSFSFIKSITTGFVSQSTGSRDYESLFKSIYQLLFITTLISFLILLFREKIIYHALNLVDGSSDVLINSRIYLEIRIWSIPAIFIRDILIGYYIGTQKTLFAMAISMSINIINIFLDILFIYYLNYSIEGAAYASVIAEYSVLIFVIYAVITEKHFKKISISELLDAKSLSAKVRVNLDMFIRSLILMTCFAFFMLESASFGDSILAANTILLNFFFIFSHGIDGFAHASEVLVGDAVGQKNRKLLVNSVYTTGKYSLILSFIFIAFFALFGDDIVSVISNLTLLRQTVNEYIIWLFGIFLLATVAFWLDGVFIGLLETTLLRNIMIASGSIFFIIQIFIGNSNNHYLWLCFLIFFSLRSIFLGYSLIGKLKNY
tara:strand:+ start:556 stop:1755 length:1200 start_codon:yes stop_codon:yes gene_type:complete